MDFSNKKWFYFNENDHNGGSICLRMPSIEELELLKIEKVGKRFQYDTKRKKLKKRKGIVNEPGISRQYKQLIKDCIVAWKDIMIEGEEVECNDVNKTRLVEIPQFLSYTAMFFNKLSDEVGYKEQPRG